MKNKITKPGRNDPCPCGSGKKYKKCCYVHRDFSEDYENLYLQNYGIQLKKEKDIIAIRRAGELAVSTLNLVQSRLRPGITTDDVNTWVHEFTIQHGARPAPLNYRGFPKSVCVSVNEEICHGIPGKRILNEGDIVNVDVTPVLEGYYADANKTFFIDRPTADAEKIVNTAKICLQKGMKMVRPGNTLGDIGWAIQTHAEDKECSVVREFVGHGVGFEFHEPPQVPHYGRRGEGIILVPGMVFTIEPMINLGERYLHILEDQWTAVTDDGSLSAQFEQTVLVTPEGFESLTPFDLS
ncbi:MAG: type I methionyl aminopeptidase [Desulfobacterales bacterium]